MAKHGLNSKTWIRAIGLSFLKDQTVERERREKGRRRRRGRGRGREEEEKLSKKVWKQTLSMEIMKISMDLWNFSMDFYDFWYGSLEICMDTCLWVVGCKKPNPRITSYGIKSMESFL